MVKNKLQCLMRFIQILPNRSTSFRKERSMADNLTCLTANVEEAFSTNKGLLAAFLDVSAAFDNVNL